MPESVYYLSVSSLWILICRCLARCAVRDRDRAQVAQLVGPADTLRFAGAAVVGHAHRH